MSSVILSLLITCSLLWTTGVADDIEKKWFSVVDADRWRCNKCLIVFTRPSYPRFSAARCQKGSSGTKMCTSLSSLVDNLVYVLGSPGSLHWLGKLREISLLLLNRRKHQANTPFFFRFCCPDSSEYAIMSKKIYDMTQKRLRIALSLGFLPFDPDSRRQNGRILSLWMIRKCKWPLPANDIALIARFLTLPSR